MAETSRDIIANGIELAGQFLEIAANDPLSAVLLAIGGLLTGFSVALFGYLSLGGVLSAIARGLPTGGAPPQQGR